jgi:hypothetical protein
MSSANSGNCRSNAAVSIKKNPVPTEGTGTTAEFHDELISFCFSYINKFNCCETSKERIEVMESQLEKAQNEVFRKYDKNLESISSILVELTHDAPVLAYEYAKYLRLHGIPDDGIFDAELLSQYKQEKIDLGLE